MIRTTVPHAFDIRWPIIPNEFKLVHCLRNDKIPYCNANAHIWRYSLCDLITFDEIRWFVRFGICNFPKKGKFNEVVFCLVLNRPAESSYITNMYENCSIIRSFDAAVLYQMHSNWRELHMCSSLYIVYVRKTNAHDSHTRNNKHTAYVCVKATDDNDING